LDDSLFSVEERYNTQTIQLISLLYLKKKQKSTLSICQMLGINIKEYESIIKIGKEKHLFDENEELTSQAVHIVEQIRKKIKFQEKNQITNQIKIEEDIVYVPKIFRGSS
jgi:FAD synthase